MDNMDAAQDFYDQQLPRDCRDATPLYELSCEQAREDFTNAIRRGDPDATMRITGNPTGVKLRSLIFWFDSVCADQLLAACALAENPSMDIAQRNANVVKHLQLFVRQAAAEYAADYVEHEE